ncbi:MAG: hypothetical protein ACFFDT_07720 [Candidatus Hodarchaeota archaeon]
MTEYITPENCPYCGKPIKIVVLEVVRVPLNKFKFRITRVAHEHEVIEK